MMDKKHGKWFGVGVFLSGLIWYLLPSLGVTGLTEFWPWAFLIIGLFLILGHWMK
jgi:threonine/homoserine/homoserine lactone efflux protein